MFLLIFYVTFMIKAVVQGEIEKSCVAEHIWKEKGKYQAL